jgi:hypothetical protein
MTLVLGGESKMSDSDSILDTIMKMLGPEGDYEHFGTDIIVHINSAFERAIIQTGQDVDLLVSLYNKRFILRFGLSECYHHISF